MFGSHPAVPAARRAGFPWLALAALVLTLALLDSVVAGAQTRTFFDPATGETTTFHGPEIAGGQTGLRSDGTPVHRQRGAAGVETWRNLDGSGVQWVQPDRTGTGSRTVLDPSTGELRTLQQTGGR